MARLLVIEDNGSLAFALRTALEIAGHEVAVASDGQTGLEQALAWQPDLMVLDLMLPGINGYSILHALRKGGSTVPILILTARGQEEDKVLGFELGADDYVTKPFGRRELLARVTALLRRRGAATVPATRAVTCVGDLEVDEGARTVTRSGRTVDLTPKEFDLLVALLRRRGVAVSRLHLLREVWGYASEIESRTVDTHVADLRRKLGEDPAKPHLILTVRKFGYRFTVS